MSKTTYGWLTFPAMLVLLAMAGCAPFAYLVTEFSPPQTIPAKYTIPSGKRVMVFVDDYSNPDELIQTYDLKRRLTEKLNEHFIENDVAKEIVPFPVIAELRASTPEFRTLYVEQVGDKLQADVIVYVHVDTFAVRDDQVQPLWHGKLRCSVKVLDVDKGMAGQGGKLWPQDAPMQQVSAVDIPAETETSSNYGEELVDELTDTMADRIGKLFHDYKVRSSEVGWDKAKTGGDDQ